MCPSQTKLKTFFKECLHKHDQKGPEYVLNNQKKSRKEYYVGCHKNKGKRSSAKQN